MAASPPTGNPGAVQILAPARRPVVARDPIVSPTLSTPAFRAATRDLVTPAALQRLVALHTAHPRALGAEGECMAKVVYHEAANQALPGQLAVAQVILNRVNSGSAYPRSVCGVVNQPGQFSEIASYVAPKVSRTWRVAVAIAEIAREDHLAQVAPGALFFHAAYVHPAWSHTRARIAQIGGQVFYR